MKKRSRPDNMNINQYYYTLRLQLLDKKLEILTVLKEGYLKSNELNDHTDDVRKLLNQKSFGLEEVKMPLEQSFKDIAKLERNIEAVEKDANEQGELLALKYIEDVLSLSAYGKLCLEMALAFELENKYKKIYAYLNNDDQKCHPTYQIAFELLNYEIGQKFSIKALQSENPTLTQMIMKSTHEEDFMILDEDVLRWIIGSSGIGESSVNHCKLHHPYHYDTHNWKPEVPLKINQYVQASLEDQKKMVFISGGEGTGKTYQVHQWAKEHNCSVLTVDYRELIQSEEDLELYFFKIIRDINLINGVFLFDNYEHDKTSKREKRFFYLIERMCNFVFIASRHGLPHKLSLAGFSILNIEIDILNHLDRKKVWETLAGEKHMICSDWSGVAGSFKFSIGSIKSVIDKLYALENWSRGSLLLEEAKLFEACYGEIKHELDKSARKLNSKYTFSDLVLPESIIGELKEICSRVKNSNKVYHQWGFGEKLSYGKGLAVIFSGEPGTGKTMSAHAIANELKLEIYQIDLSSMVSKYIGETEKNLSKIFDEAKRSNAILFFDEAESLFGKRTEVSNSNDKHANNQTSFLLQKIEAYEGITILATNFKKSMDKAFVRRMNHIIEFHMPSADFRKEIWTNIYPKQTPLSMDVDFDYISEKFELTGGNIKNIALRSAFMAAEKDSEIMMKDILIATKEEMHKIGKVFINNQTDEYAELYEEF